MKTLATLALLCLPGWLLAQPQCTADYDLRVAVFNAYLNRPQAGQLRTDLATRKDAQAHAVAAIIQQVRPDVLLFNEFDYDQDNTALALFQQHYLGAPHTDTAPIHYPHQFSAPVNTGVASGFDLDQDGTSDGPADSWGYGVFPGQYGMAVLSQHPIQTEAVRSWQNFKWRDMPGALLPSGFYSQPIQQQMPLSSKSHWDVPIRFGRTQFHLLAAHPTPPIFDGDEDRNGRRNHDEIRLWKDYISGAEQAAYLYDDQGQSGGLDEAARFVIAGDYNADPFDGDSYPGAINQLVQHAKVNDRLPPTSRGGEQEAEREGGKNIGQQGPPNRDTSDINPSREGNLRIDYVLPSKQGWQVVCSGVFWPTADDPQRVLVGDGDPIVSSDHRLVWVDLVVKP